MRTTLLVCAVLVLAAGSARAERPEAELPGATASFAATGITRSATLARPSRCGGHGSYGWPVRPFGSAHPVRGNFGDPRTVFGAVSSFSFHNGIDVAAPAGRKVYPVASGVANYVGTHGVIVRTPDGRSFQYWHLVPLVRMGQRVYARRTALGTVEQRAGHVHFAEIDDGVVRNPLAPGHLGPYLDRRAPIVHGVAFRGEDGASVDPDALRGAAEVIVWADDATALPVPGRWRGLPVSPARIAYSVLRQDGSIVVAERTIVDYRYTLPEVETFWDVFASGTHQNVPPVGRLLRQHTPGRYLYRFELPELPPGRFVLRVVAEDICGNRGMLTHSVATPAPAPQPVPEPAPPPTPVRPARGAQAKPWSWPRGRTAYTVVVASIPVGRSADARRRALEAIAAHLPRVGILRSSRFANLAPGYLVVFSGAYGTSSQAILASLNVRDGYPRLVVPSRIRARARRSVYVLASVPLAPGRAAAVAEAARARAAGIRRVRIVRSSRLSGFRAGYFVVLGDRAASIYPGAYPRALRLRATAPSRAVRRSAPSSS